MVESCEDQYSDSLELEPYNQFMRWLEEAKASFSSWYDRQTNNSKLVIITRHLCPSYRSTKVLTVFYTLYSAFSALGWLGSRVVSILDSDAVGPEYISQSRRCRVTVLGKLFTPIMSLFTKQQNW